ncbi:class F sortase [Nocardioides limicola]|uniref:class F sortase n=1 Tax=Nocardioides limicola TaxID=2803368 RepID=UPI00193B274F|nr:class F sortase [Nocardioides sp. DJM-14]
MNRDRVGEYLRTFAASLLAFCLVLVLAGAVLPSAPVKEPKVAPAQPVRLIVPSIDLRAPIRNIEVDMDGVLWPPDNVNEVGWWERSAKPGATRGQTVITGHTVARGGGVMNDLGDVEVGDTVRVRTREGLFDYEATEIFVYSRAELAENAEMLFGQDRKQVRLVLITCTDFDGRVYQSNIILFAKPIGSRPHEERSEALN